MKSIKMLICAVVALAAAGGALWLVDHRQFFGAQTGYVIGGLMAVFFVFLFIAAAMLSSMRRGTAALVQTMKRRTPPPDYETVAAKLDQIEAELKRMGAWQDEPLPPERYEFRQAFAMDTMAFEQWLQFVFIPRVRSIIETRGEFPPYSEVGAHAIREFDGRTDTDTLWTLLNEFDRLFGPVRFKGVDY